MKKSILMLLTSAICVQSIPILAYNNEFQIKLTAEAVATTFDFTIQNDGVTITNYTGTNTNIIIPTEINGLPVTAIGNSAFCNKQLTTVIIPNSVISIGENAFFGNNLTSISIPQSISSIDSYAFSCNPLSTVTIPSSVDFISSSAFKDTNNLKHIYIEKDEYSIPGAPWGADAKVIWNYIDADITLKTPSNRIEFTEGEYFDPTGIIIALSKDNETIKEVSYSENESAFDFSPSLDTPLTKDISSISISYNGLTFEHPIKVVDDIFEILVENNTATITNYKDINPHVIIPEQIKGFEVTSIGNSAFYNKCIKSISLPSTLTSIGENAFWGNYLESITLPENLLMIGSYAFSGNLFESILLPNNLIHISPYALEGVDNLATIYVENNEHSLPNAPWGSTAQVVWNYIDADMEIKTTPTKLNYTLGESFDPSGLSITLIKDNEVIKDIDYLEDPNGFDFSPSLNTPLTEEDTLITVTYNGLKVDQPIKVERKDFEILVENNTATITNYLGTATDVIIPEEINGFKVTTIGHSAFYNKQLTSVVLPNTITSIGENAFWGNHLDSIILPENLLTIGAYAFSGNTFTSITIPNSVSYISPSAFQKVASLQTIYINQPQGNLVDFPWGAPHTCNIIYTME